MRTIGPMAVALLTGCQPEATIRGTVLGWRDAPVVASGASLTMHDAAYGVFDTTTTAADGTFSIQAPSSSEIHLEITGEGLVPIAFLDVLGPVRAQDVPLGRLWAFRPEDEAAWRADFAGCPGAEDGAGMIVGTAYLAVQSDDVTATGSPWPYAFATLEPRDTPGEGRIDACYLADDDATVAHDPDAWRTGVTGRFAFFGVEGGPWALTVGRCVAWTDDGCTSTMIGRSSVFVPEGGVVERDPALVPF